MRILAYPADRFACGHYRVAWPAQVVANSGADVVLVPPGQSSGIRAMEVGGRVVSVDAPECDVMVFQRPAQRRVADMIPLLRAKGVAVVVDVDDDLERIHPSNPAFRGMHPTWSPDYNWEHLRRACREATLVTVSTPALMPRYGAHGRVRLVRNYVPERFLEMPHDVELDSPGWAGSLHSHPDDLRPASGALAALQNEGHSLRFVGPHDGLSGALGVELVEGACTGNLEFSAWQPAIAARIGVGVAPLAATSFNEAKSWLKPLEYSAAGVPWVASDTPEYRRLAKLVGAPIASRPREWYRELKSLTTDSAKRADASGRVREAARSLTVEARTHEWLEAWEHAMTLQRGGVTARGVTDVP